MQKLSRGVNWKYDWYKAGNAYYCCDRCSQRWRRSTMLTEWDGLKVCPKCIDPRPPQLIPPTIYPEGMPFRDARPPQDNPDRLQDDTSLQAVPGGFIVTPPGQLYPNGQSPQPGALSPSDYIENPTPQGSNILEDDITFITGVLPLPSQTDLPQNLTPPLIVGNNTLGSLLSATTGQWLLHYTYTYQWLRGTTPIGGATSSTYTIVNADLGKTLYVNVTASNNYGSFTVVSVAFVVP